MYVDVNLLAFLLIGLIGLTILLTQIKMFSLARDVGRIREILEEQSSGDQKIAKP